MSQNTFGGTSYKSAIRGRKADANSYDSISRLAEGAIKVGSFVKAGTDADTQVKLIDNAADVAVGFAPSTHAFEQVTTGDVSYADKKATDVITRGVFYVELFGDTAVAAYDSVQVDIATGEVSNDSLATKVTVKAKFLKGGVAGDILPVYINTLS